ncbi:ADP-ribosyltransferase-containing protein [Akkermansia sp.]
MSLNLTEAWKDVPPPSPSGTQDSAEAASGPPPAPDSRASFLLSPGAEAQQTAPLLGAFGNVQDATDAKDRENSLLAAFPRQAATPLSPAHPRSLFDSPLTRPLLPSSAPSISAYKPDPQRIEELHALILHNKQDPELAALLERNPAFRAQAALDDGSMPARALLGQQILREIAGEKYAGEPGFYFLALKEKLPEAATRQEAYAAVYDHYSKVVDNQYEENRKRRAAYQNNRAQVEEAVAHVVSGLWSPSDLTARLTPEQLGVYQKEFDTTAIEKAHAAFSFLKQAFSDTPDAGLRRMVSERTAMKITSALSDDDGSGKLMINETAFQLFEGSLKNLMGQVKEETGDKFQFLHNLKIALFNPAIKRDATLGTALQLSGQQDLLVPFAREHNKQVFGLMAQTVRDYETYVKNDKENARVLGLLSTGQDLGNQASDRASFAARTVNCLGSVTGQTLPFFIPYAGWGVALAEAFDDKRNRAYYAGLQPGTAEWSAFIDAAASVAVEKISYGGIGRLSGAGWLMGKLPFMNKTRQALTDSLWKHVLFETGAGITEETVAEPTAEAIIQWVVRNNLAPLVNLNVGGNYDWNNYWQELHGMLSPDQFAATALFVGGLAGMQAPSLHRSLITYSKNEEMLMTQGIPKEEAQRIAAIENDKERIAAARQARGKAWENYEQAAKNAKAGMAAFRHLGEVQATVESEAYKYFQQSMHLPLVEEKLDKPGTYAVTVYDRDSGKKKFTQDMTGDQLVALFGQYFSRAEQMEVRRTQSEFAANAILRSAEATGEIQAQDMLQWGQDNNKDGRKPEAENASTPRQPQTEAPVQDTPSPAQQEKPAPATTDTQETAAADSAPAQKTETETAASLTTLGGFVRAIGAMSQTAFTHLTRIATQEYRRRTDSGMSAQEAAATPFAALSPYVPLSSIMALDQEFGQRLRIGAKTTGEENFKYTRLFKMRTAPGTTPADTLFLLARGNIGSRELLEDLFEWKLGKITLKDPVRLQAIASLLRDTQASMRQLGFKGQFVEPKGELSDMQIVEAMSKLALSDMLSNADSLPLPQWQKDLLQYHVNTLGDAAYLLHIGQAYDAGRKAGTITQDMADILRDLGHEVHTVFGSARIEQADIQAVMDARAIIDGRAPSGTPTASQIRERQQKDAEEEKAHITTGDKGKERSVPKEAYRHPETISLPEAPSSMQGVFANGASWNPDAGTWLGMVPVDKLHLSPEVPQVKVNSGKKGVVNPLVGDYRADAPPIYVWKRKNGWLEVVSGRHRLDLAQRTGTKNIPAYVYEEDAAHDAKWARLLDYEQNMQDDQADELTAAIYVRETSLTDDELTRRGLTRSGTKSRRGLLIGREAREDLWTRFKSGAIRAQDAEAICLLTQHIQDKARIDAMQTAAANDLARGKSLEFVAAKIQLMAHASADGKMVQGLISFGESFEADMEKAAEYVSLCITTINEHINAIKGVRTISKKGSVLATEGITAGLSADPAERLKELELLKAMYEKIGLYENLRVRALTWDGHTPPDPIGDHRLDMQAERARAEEEAAALENEENRKVSEALTPELTFSLTPSRDLETTFPALWGQAARELNARGQVSFSLNGSHVAIHTLSEEKMRHVLELGGMPNPAIQIADLDSGPTYYAEIACILHPDRIDPAKTPGARIWRGDAWTRQMPEKISEDGDPWEGYEHGPEEIPGFYDEHGDLREWNRENLDAYMKAKHLESFLPHNMTPDEVLDNYGTDGAALPIIMASQAYAAEFPSLKEALRTDNLSFQLDRHEAETATRQLEDQFKALLGSYYFEPRSLQHFLIGYWWRDISHENVRNALIGEGLLDDPDTVYDEEENPEEYNDLQSSNDYIAEEVRAFLDACRTSAKIYYEAAPGGWLFPSDFSGFILPSSLGPSLRSELEKYNVPIHTYDLTEQEALTLGNPWTLAKASWLREEVDERRNEAIRNFLEVHDISFSLSGAEERDDPSAFLPHSSPSPDFPLALSPVRLSSSFHAVEQASPVTLAIPASAREDKTQGFSKLARQAFTVLREKTRQRTLFANGREKTSEQLKPPLLMPDGRRIYLSNRGWKHIMATSPETRTLAAIGALEPLLASARYMYSVPEFDNASPDQTKSWHYYLAKIRDSLHGPGYVLFTFREDTRGCYLEGVETAAAAALDKTGSASSQVDFGATRRATGRSLPVRTLLSLKQFVNFIDKGGAEAFRAPNGQPSRLAPDQWHLVRTAPFMRYFGDWLRDPSASSVVLDDNGEPRVCYRGLKQSYNPGVRRNYTWISSSRELSEQYAAGGTVLDLFVATRRPFHFPDSLTRQSPEHFRENIRRQLEQDRALGFFAEEQLQEASRKLETLLQGTEETEAFKIWERHRELKDILSSLGYDSVMTEENGVMTYGLFRPGQAKSAVGNCGSYDITLSDITFALTPREQRTAAQALVEDTFLRAPDGTPTALTERQWLQANSAAFKKWFGQSKVVNAHGDPVIVYHGTARKDRVGTVFRPERATSGPMAFFTDSPEIASNYSRNKTDTSIDYEEEDYHDYHRQFRVTLPSGRDIPLERYWNYLSPEERQRIARTAGHIRTDWEGDDSIILDPSADEANGGFRFHLQEARGNALRALVYHWLDSGTLFGQEARFLDVLSKLDLPIAPWYRDPDYTEPGVYACYLHMEHPFRTNGITGKILTSLKAASRKAGSPAQKGGLLSWSKNDLAPEAWIDTLEEDVKNGTTYAWTTIPDWVTACLKRLGYDGIIDQGGKFHSDIHTVYIPFSPYQLKSATDNNGSFDSSNPDITFALSPEERLITEQAKADGTWLQAPNGQPSLLEPKLWATVRTRAFRDWFGDWLHAPEQSSRVVDVNGEPLPVYHGSHRAGFTIFDTALGENPSQFGTPDDCYFFSDSRQVAITYCKLEDPASAREAELPALSALTGQRALFPAVYTCFINIRLPLEADFQGNYWDGRDAEDTSGEGDVPTTNTIALEAREQGYDAAIIRNVIDMGDDAPYHLPSTVYSVFDPSQIKSAYANRGTFDSGNPDITFSLWDDAEDSYTVMERSASPLTAEEQSILARARDAGNDLLAPNGQPTRLTEKQWAQARTKAFLAWFGDWLHDPANASKPLDENGEPIVLYHGGSFDIRRSPSVFDGVPHVDGIFFSDSTELAKSYQAYQGGGITTAWLNLKNPFLAQDEASARFPWVDEFIDYWQEEEGWTDRYSGESMDRESVRDMIREGSLYEYDMGQRWSDFLGWVREHHDGYFGHDPTDMGALIAVAFKSIQVKSSEYNSGAFSASEPDITFSLSNLAAIHSLDEEKFLAVDKLGGLPLPSIAVTRLDRPYTWGGEGNIYLVGSPALADPARGVEIHDRDAWSGYFPELRWSRQEEKEREDFYNRAQEAALRYYGGTDISSLRFLKNALDGDHRGELENKLRHNDFSLAVFAAERGYAPRPVTTKIPGRLNTGDKIFYAEIRKMLPWKDANTLSPDRQDDFCKAMERAIERYRSQFSQDSRDAQLTVPQTLTRKSNLRAMEKELREARGDGFQSISYLALQDARQAGKKALDSHANYKRFEKYAAQHKKAFNAWVEDKLARWLNPVPRIRETGLPATLENITRHMLESKGMGAERGLVFSTGLLRARQARRFNSLEEIKASRNNLVTTEEEKASRQKAQDLIHQFQMALSRIDGSFSAFDNAVKALSLVRGAPTPQKVLAALSRLYRGTSFQGRIARDSRLPGLGSAALSALHAELRDYYEAVPRRSVQLREFSHAVLPAALRKNKQVRDVLKRHQIRPLYHDGTREGRFQALASLIGSSASFSLTSLEEIVSGLAAPSMQATRASELVKDFGKAAENWRRVMSGKEEKPSARVGAELFGMINSLLSSARYVLPKGYRSNVDLQMQWASVYAAMAESGEIPPKGTLRSGDSFYKKFETSMINATTSAATPEEVRQILASIGSQRLDHVMSKVLDRVRTQLVYFAKDELYQKTMRRVEAVYPKKEPGKKSPRGRLEAAAYRTLARYRQMLDAQSQAKAEAMTTLEALYNQEEDEEKRQEHERDILAWKTYGDYAGMSLPQAREAMEKLLEFILSGRNSWERKLTREAGRIKYAARQIQKNLPAVNSGSSRAGAKISHRTKLRKLLSSLPYSVMSYAQLMLALEPVLGQHFSRARIKEITEANASLLNTSNDRSAWLSGTIRRIAGVKSESAAEQWLVQFNTPQATGIPIAPVLTVKVSLSIENAQEWLSLSSQERKARRQAIREEDRRTETLTENVPGEEDIPLLRQALDEYESRTPEQRQYQHNVTSEREVPNTEAASQLICSRDCALYAILLHEQPDYADVYDSKGNLIRKGFLRREGLDDKGIGDLYDYVGPDGLEYGYALRRKLNETGLTLAQVYEERMGVPFTLKPDYFRATFDRNSTREKDALTEPKTGSIGGGKYGLLIDRVVHSENLDFSKSGTLVFLAAAAEQDNYIYTSHITTAWRALLKNKPLEQKLKQHLGEDMMGKLSSWMDLIDGASLENNRAFLNLSRMQDMLQKAFAISVLAGNGYVLLKQATAILHGFFAGWVPSAILEKADGTRELAHKHISFSSFLFHLAASKLGLGDIAMKEVAATPYFTARMRGEGAMLAQLGNQMPGQRYSRMEKLPEKSMDLIEAVDVKANLLAMHALANAYYARSRSLNRENGSPFTDEELRQAALEQVGMSLELGAQPLTKTQKSMSQAAGGILSRLTFVMKSEQLNKIGLMAAEWKTGSARNRVCAAQSWLALGVTSSLLAWFIAWIKGMEDDDDKAKKWKKYGATVLLGDLTTIPLAGEGVNYLASLFTGEHVFADSYARTLIDVQGIARTITREYEHVADKKEMDWDTHFNNLTALVRAAGVGGAFSRSSSAIVSSYGALSLSAATGANISRTAKDLLTRLFGTPEEDRKKKKKKRKSGKKKNERLILRLPTF